MNSGLKKIAFLIGLGILGVSIYWSQDGFNFDIAGKSGYGSTALVIGYFLAFAFSTLQFVFSSNFRELNMSLILLGAIAYMYSIYTNYQGIIHFQGDDPNNFWSGGLAFFLDASAEPLIAWSLGVSREGDFIGNIVKTIFAFFNGVFEGAKGEKSDNKPRADLKPTFSPKSEESGRKVTEKRENMPFSFNMEGDRRKSKRHPNLSNLHGVKPEKSRTYYDE